MWKNGLDNENGLDTKKYFDSKEARKLVLQFIEKMIDKYLKSIAPAIIIRGAHSEMSILYIISKDWILPFTLKSLSIHKNYAHETLESVLRKYFKKRITYIYKCLVDKEEDKNIFD